MEKDSKRIGIIFSKEILDMVDDYRKGVPGIPDRTNTIREMIKLGYEAHKNKEKESKG